MSDDLVVVTANSHIIETILGALMIAVSFLFKRALSAQDKKIEDNRREIRLVNEKNQKELKDIHDIIRQTDHYLSDIQSDVAFIRGKLANNGSENP